MRDWKSGIATVVTLRMFADRPTVVRGPLCWNLLTPMLTVSPDRRGRMRTTMPDSKVAPAHAVPGGQAVKLVSSNILLDYSTAHVHAGRSARN
jgi:hypothetical protein